MGWCVFLVLVLSAAVRGQNCRGGEHRERACANVCDDHGVCTIRAALLLPKNTTYDACLPVVRFFIRKNYVPISDEMENLYLSHKPY